MRRFIVALLLAVSVVGLRADGLPRATPESVGMSSQRLSRIAAALKQDVDNGRMPGAVIAIARRGKLVYYESFGFLDKGKGTPMPKDAIFSIASMTKPVVAAAGLTYYEENRLLVHEPVAERVLVKLKNRIRVLRVGDPMDKNTDIGAINSKEQLQKITKLVEIGVKEGAEIFQPTCRLPTKGYYFRPTLFSGVSMSHRVAREEIFGPVLSILTFRTVEEAIEKANNTEYGLSAGVWTDKGSRILKMSTELKAGVVWANTYNKFDPTSPFGGYKESGFGREGGRQGLLDYCQRV